MRMSRRSQPDAYDTHTHTPLQSDSHYTGPECRRQAAAFADFSSQTPGRRGVSVGEPSWMHLEECLLRVTIPFVSQSTRMSDQHKRTQ